MGFIDTGALPTREPRQGWKGRFFHSDNMTFAHYTVDAGAWIHEHSHPNDEVWNVIEGELEMTIGDETRIVGSGGVAVIPPDVVHSARARTTVRAIVVDHPRRDAIGGHDLT
jgi:quercetin dioxygenase-like cupin family protein